MQKLKAPCDDLARIRFRLFDGTLGTDIFQKYPFEEFGISAREVLSDDLLMKTVADDRVSQGLSKDFVRTTVYACFHWKQQLPFVIVEREERHVTSHYTPQYGRDDNYNDSWESETRYDFYTIAECERRKPDVAKLLATLE